MPSLPRWLSFFALAVALASVSPAQTVQCPPSWTPGFFPQSSGSGSIQAQVVFDDGTGPAIYVGTNGSPGVSKLTTAGWQAVGSLGYTNALAVFDHGTGPKLYALSDYVVSRWNGTTWSTVGQFNNPVHSLTTITVGTTTSLFAGGDFFFEYLSSQSIARVARFNGASWSSLGPGLDGNVYAMIGFNDGSGSALYVGGYSLTISTGGPSLGQLAKWNGTSWTSVGNLCCYGAILDLEVFNNGGGPALFAGTGANGNYNPQVLRWNGQAWTPVGSGFSGYGVTSMTPFDDGSGPALYIGGNLTMAGGVPVVNIARWRPTGWEAVGIGIPGGVSSLLTFDDGSGPALWASEYVLHRWNGSAWSTVGEGVGQVNALAYVDFGLGAKLVAGGQISSTTGANFVAVHAATGWEPLGMGIGGTVKGLATFDDGTGPSLFACGDLSPSLGSPATGLARWNGTTWSGIGDLNPTSLALASIDDGTGPALYVGGTLTWAAGIAVNNLARWNGTTWSPLGSGLNGPVRAIALYDDGTGPALYIGGDFTYASGAPANGIAKWSGSHWSPIGIGVGGAQPFVHALAVFESVGGPALYVAGPFTSAGGIPVQGLARLTGESWSSVGSANGSVYALTVFDLGDGPALYAGGSFTSIGPTSANGVAKWNGVSWSGLTTGVLNPGYPPTVRALAGIRDQSGAALWAGGDFKTAGPYASGNIARYAATAPVHTAPATWPVGTPLAFGIQGATAGEPYVFDFSITGSVPGFNLGSVHVPMNEPLVNYTYGYLFPGVFTNFWGYLDTQGQATATLHLPNDPILAGFTLSSSFATLDFSASSGIGGVACPRSTTLIPAKPKIFTVSPPTAPSTGGPTISITGSGFQAAATVRIGAGYATNVTISPALITCTAPPGVVGPVSVRVDNPNGAGVTKSGVFGYVTPIAITGTSPVVAAPGATITIDGAGFQAGATATMGGASAPVMSVSPVQIQCTRPAGVPCDTSLFVQNPDGQTASVPFNPAPTIGLVIGGTGPAAGGTPAFILGTNFHPGTTVTIGGALAAIQSQDLTSILVTVPPGIPGPTPLVVTSAAGCTASSTFVYY